MTEQKREEKNIVMQIRCIYCKREQYAPAVYEISNGRHHCVWCGKAPPVFTNEKEYWDIVKPVERDSNENTSNGEKGKTDE